METENNDKLIIAIDFDGTIVEEREYPNFGPLMPYAKQVINALKEEGHTLILWTVRYADGLKPALEFIRKENLHFDYINENDIEFAKGKMLSPRKIYADLYIDDRVFGDFPGWKIIAQKLLPTNKWKDIFSKC